MWCLEQLRLGPEGLLRRGDWFFRGRVHRSANIRSTGFANVLTPDCIPEFCIPPRLPSRSGLASLRNFLGQEWGANEGAARTDWDPRSQAALSLPHLPRAPTTYGFCALLESPHTRRKESLFLGDPSATAALLLLPAARPAPRPRAHTYSGGGGDGPREPQSPLRAPSRAPTATPAPGSARPHWDPVIPRPRGRRLLRAPDGLLRRTLWARRSCGLARARSVSSGDEDEEEEQVVGSRRQVSDPSASATLPSLSPQPQRLEAEGTVTLSHCGGVLRLAAEYCPGSGHLRIRLLRTEGLAGTETRAISYRLSFVLQPAGKTRKQRSAVVLRSHKAVFDQDLCLDGLSEDKVRRMAVCVKVESKGRGLERGRLLGQGELLLGSLLLL
ncbi:PREDICTED: C2 calcium-dependent domain-containing protein 4A-like [Elephantulus edwardii]|uniref:C2 calcium-dependent domain-containing protein 4A-like n=1 Tax=Elephantulus edwardii TaxID=28737 RepID=UPI0003F0EB31|nr:PREDICTED: C2 calcium-dependent domain-containing protein 4A-like [Elephantulus edwardii]